jgi:hypothetical protein
VARSGVPCRDWRRSLSQSGPENRVGLAGSYLVISSVANGRGGRVQVCTGSRAQKNMAFIFSINRTEENRVLWRGP